MNSFKPNTTFLTTMFKAFNATYFNNELPMVTFIYNHSKRNLGQYNRENNTIRITLGRPEMTQHDCEEILIHEMVHAWQNYMGASYWKDKHRGCFRVKANEINRKSNNYFHIARCTNLENATPREIKRNTDYVQLLVCRNAYDKHYYVGRVMDYHNFERWLGKYYSDIRCFECSGKGLNGFVRSRVQFNYKTFNEDTFKEKVQRYLKKEIPFDNKAKKTA